MKLLILAAVCVGSLAACKKGKDDPFLSLKSRDKRLQQEWVLKKMTFIDQNESNGHLQRDEAIFDGSTIHSISTWDSTTTESTDPFEMTLTIKKNGDYSYHISDGINSETYNLLWHWVDTDKKKTRLQLFDFPYSYLYEPLTVDRLSSKELILSGDFVNDQPLFKATVNVKMEFERK